MIMKETKFWQDQEKDWKFYFDEGKSYLNTCNKLINKKGVFDNEFIYNLAVLAGERLTLGMLLSYNYIPASTSLAGMLKEGKELYPLAPELIVGARIINRFQAFCSLDVVPLTAPKDDELVEVVEYINLVDAFCTQYIKQEVIV